VSCELCGAKVQALLFGHRLLLCASCYALEQDFRPSVVRHKLQTAIERRDEEGATTLMSVLVFLNSPQP